MASPEEERRRAVMLDERRRAGDAAWSPSRAREALRAFGVTHFGRDRNPHQLCEKAADTGALDGPEAFDAFCMAEFGSTVWA